MWATMLSPKAEHLIERASLPFQAGLAPARYAKGIPMKGTGLLLLLALALLLGGALVSVPRAPADPLFQGKPESDWITLTDWA